MQRIVLALVLGMLSVISASAQGLLPDKRLVVTQDVDFYGGDMQPLFDTDFAACQRLCLNNDACVALTFNARSQACFPKSSLGASQPYTGALSAVVLRAAAGAQSLAETQKARLAGFLTARDIAAATEQAQGIGPMHRGGEWTVADLVEAARRDEAAGQAQNAAHWIGAAVAQSDAADLWVDYARLSNLLAESASRFDDKRSLTDQALRAATNAFLRTGAGPVQVNALAEMAAALERLERGRDMLRALRLAETIQPRADIVASLEDAIGKYGFRIVEHEVESETAAPRLCAQFSEPLKRTGVDFGPYVRVPDATMAVEAEGDRLCVTGVRHGQRYTVTFRSGLPADSGESLIRDVSLTLYVRDRSPRVSFPGRAYVLPKTADAGIPIETVNLTQVDLTLRRVDDRTVLRTIQDGLFGSTLRPWEMDRFEADLSEPLWSGTGEVPSTLNQTVLTRLPVGEALAALPPGLYALSAAVPGADPYDDPGATQWFVLSDIGLTTLQGSDGLTVIARRLTDAEPMAGLELQLLARSNRVLGTAATDAAGVASFAPGLMRGTGAAQPALVVAQVAGDLAFLSLGDPAFDLSDRGVAGRDPGGPIDVFLATDRGAYRAGETIHATALMRDPGVRAVTAVPLTAVLTRPDGVEHARQTSAQDQAGGHVFDLGLTPSVPRGTWRLELFTDPKAPALASQTLLVEDFVPERIDFELTLPEGLLRASDQPELSIAARYLFGAPGGDLPVEGELRTRSLTSLDAFPGYRFGRHDAESDGRTTGFGGDLRTDADGRASLTLPLPAETADGRPREATATVRIAEGSGRPVERRITRQIAPAGPMIGIKPAFDGELPENATAAFALMALGADLAPVPMQVRWTLNRVTTRYQWYQVYGNWEWEPVTTRQPVASGTADLAGSPAEIAAPVDWGRYEIVVERTDGAYVASSVGFYAGWYVPADVSTTPDMLELSLDKPAYRPGDTAMLRVVPRYAGKALITVMSDHVIAMQAVEVPEGESVIALPVTEEWGAGAYVTASVLRPMDIAAGQNPARALGLAHAAIDPGARKLSVTLTAPEEAAPRGTFEAQVRVEGARQDAWMTIAAVDLGILNLTGFQSPDPAGHYFGQRRLGVEIRDLYGRLIDGQNGEMGRLRSGGDAGAEMRLQSPPPTEELVAFFSGPVQLLDGEGTVSFHIPEFNGTVRLMAVVWTDTAVGQAQADVLVRDPVVVSASLPRFLAPGDSSRLRLDIVHARGPSGEMPLEVSSDGLMLGAGIPGSVILAEQGKTTLSVPIAATEVGDYSLTVALTTPDGKRLEKHLTLGVRANDPAVSVTRRFDLAAGATFMLDDQVFAGLRPGSAEAMIAAGPLARFDAPRLLAELNRYPYGCTEQVTSQAMPLLTLSSVAEAMGLGNPDTMRRNLDAAIAKVLTRQGPGGGFGLWSADGGDFWLDGYVTDFLTRARAAGLEVPQLALQSALDNLANQIAYAADFDEGGEAIAYALMILAREGRASMGDLRYFADEKADAFATPLAQAQLGAALAAYGDPTRADLMFAKAARRVAAELGASEPPVWRSDYGSHLRDAAGLLHLAVTAGSRAVDTDVLAARVGNPGRSLSTQEQSWALLAAQAMVQDPGVSGLAVDGVAVNGPFVRRIEGASPAPMAIANTSSLPTQVTLTTIGVPLVPEPAGGYGYAIERAYFTMEGAPIDGPIRVGDRFVTVLTVRPAEPTGARLMVNDPLPAGFEIDNPNLLRSGDVRALDWLDPKEATHAEFRADRFLAAVDHEGADAFRLAYVVRAVSPGRFHHPAASVEDMYRPQYRARTATGGIEIAE
ncbi:MAG: alpha-2-macroglobulin family protein [Roseivivax sp.]|nr:alpha-2-macroglobulin family protein [Roseivivax sp.]